jgi:hypothetical protein
MKYAVAFRGVISVLFYFMITTSLWAQEPPKSLIEKLVDPRDWIVGVVAGLVVVVLLSFRVPKIGISRSIVKTTDGLYRIKVINKRKYWWIFKGDAIDLRAELHMVTLDDLGAETVRNIPLVQHEPLIISHTHRFGRQPGRSEYVFRVESAHAAAMTGEGTIRFRLYARDSFSNYGKVFTQYYPNPIVTGNYKQPGSLDIIRAPA